jgi:hypothetical protein
MNQPAQKIRVVSDPSAKIISITTPGSTDSISKKSLKQQDTWYVKRGKALILITVQLDSITKTVKLKPVSSPAYWLNIYFNGGIGMLVDRNNLKRYAYPVNNYLSMKDTIVSVSRLMPVQKGAVNFSLSLSFINLFYMRSVNGRRPFGGVFGFQGGIDYYYRHNTYLSAGFGAGTDHGIGEYIGKGYYETGSSLFASIRNNHNIGRFDWGYGLSFLQLGWRNVTFGDTINMDRALKSRMIGLSFNTSYRLGKIFRVGILYQPGLFNVSSTPALDYQHSISFNFIWKFKLAARKEL